MDEQRCTHFFPWPTLCELAQPNASSTSLKSSVLKLHLGNWWSKSTTADNNDNNNYNNNNKFKIFEEEGTIG